MYQCFIESFGIENDWFSLGNFEFRYFNDIVHENVLFYMQFIYLFFI